MSTTDRQDSGHVGPGLRGLALQAAFRTDLVESLRLELLGPAGPDEVLGERPSVRYLLGRLAPSGTPVSQEEDDGQADADDEAGDATEQAPTVLAMNPSSIGLSVVLEPGAETVALTAGWGEYQAEQLVEEVEEPVDGAEQEGETRKRTRKRTVYRRTPKEVTVDIGLGDDDVEVADGVVVRHRALRLRDGRTALSVFLTNRREPRDSDSPDEDEWLFQPRMTLTGTAGEPVFGPRLIDERLLSRDEDLKSAELVYWNRPEYAVGHSCAAGWDDVAGHASVSRVWTDVLPVHELPRIDARDDAPGTLDMRKLGGRDADGITGPELTSMLQPMLDAYREWIADLEDTVLPGLRSQMGDELTAKAWEHLERATLAADRIQQGIQLLEDDDLARRAFCFANRVMALQRIRSVIAADRRRGQEPPSADQVPARWRPFQLAFILLNLASIVDRNHPDRRTADLLWFPTGGGKTEAYLGLTAFVLAHRRIRPATPDHDDMAGVSVLMRYTLRLLTLQQFQRATTLICAAEHLRVEEAVWGDAPFSIGLWVGQSATPNDFPSARDALNRLSEGLRPRKGSPVQLTSCPWCGETLGLQDHRADSDRECIDVTCPARDCVFSAQGLGRLPVHVVDTEVYRHVPSLVIATVDKFARMPWKGQVQALFGRVNRYCPRHGHLVRAEAHPNNHRESRTVRGASVVNAKELAPPDLIIQDELHLISGPLGTLVGIYETAVDALCSVSLDGALVGPKVIASTATIRSAKEQVGALFRRHLEIFPPQGLEATDSLVRQGGTRFRGRSRSAVRRHTRTR